MEGVVDRGVPPDGRRTVRDALTQYYRERGLLGVDETVDARLHERWIHMKVFGRLIPIQPLLGHQGPFLLHDVHHMLTGYGTSYRAELEEAAWEIGSGGCGRWILFWNSRILAFLQGLVLCPRRTLRALRAGRRDRNLYRRRAPDVLDSDLAEIVAFVHPRG